MKVARRKVGKKRRARRAAKPKPVRRATQSPALFVEFTLADPSALELDWNFNDRADRLFRTGHRLLRRGFFEEAERAFERAIRYDPSHYRAQVSRSETLILLGKVTEAAAVADAALGRYGRNCEIGAARGHVFLHQGHIDTALECANIAVQNASDNAYICLIAGETRLALREGLEAAMDCFGKARIALEPWPDLELRIALAMLECGHLDHAIRALVDVVKSRPKLPLGWILLGDAHKLKGSRRDSRVCYERAAALVPQLKSLKLALSWKARMAERWRGLRRTILRTR